MNWDAFWRFLSGAWCMWVLDHVNFDGLVFGRKEWSRRKRMNKQVDDLVRRGL